MCDIRAREEHQNIPFAIVVSTAFASRAGSLSCVVVTEQFIRAKDQSGKASAQDRGAHLSGTDLVALKKLSSRKAVPLTCMLRLFLTGQSAVATAYPSHGSAQHHSSGSSASLGG